MGLEYGCQFLTIIGVVQLGTADQGYVALHIILVQVGISKGSTVSGNEQVGTVEKRSIDRNQLNLAGPLLQL